MYPVIGFRAEIVVVSSVSFKTIKINPIEQDLALGVLR